MLIKEILMSFCGVFFRFEGVDFDSISLTFYVNEAVAEEDGRYLIKVSSSVGVERSHGVITPQIGSLNGREETIPQVERSAWKCCVRGDKWSQFRVLPPPWVVQGNSGFGG